MLYLLPHDYNEHNGVRISLRIEWMRILSKINNLEDHTNKRYENKSYYRFFTITSHLQLQLGNIHLNRRRQLTCIVRQGPWLEINIIVNMAKYANVHSRSLSLPDWRPAEDNLRYIVRYSHHRDATMWCLTWTVAWFLTCT